MEIDTTAADFVNHISEILRVRPEFSDGTYWFNLRARESQKRVALKLAELESAVGKLRLKTKSDDSALYDRRTFEVLVRQETPFFISASRSDNIEKRDSDNGVLYTVSKPSGEFLLFLIHEISKMGSIREAFGVSMVVGLGRVIEQESDDPNILDVLKSSIPRFRSLQLTSDADRKAIEFSGLANAFLFNLSYNLNIALVQQRNFNEFLRGGRIRRLRRADDFEPPKRLFIPDLVYYYQMAVSVDSPSLEYLSYYHMAEYFFERVFYEDLIQQVQATMTHPGFSFKREVDVKELIDKISYSLKYREENVTINERRT